MDRGRVVARGYAGELMLTPMTIAWLPAEIEPRGRGIGDQGAAAPFVDIGMFRWSRSPRFPAWMCGPCRIVVFSYADPEEALKPGHVKTSPPPG